MRGEIINEREKEIRKTYFKLASRMNKDVAKNILRHLHNNKKQAQQRP